MNTKSKFRVFVIALAVLLVGCGGGGTEGTKDIENPVPSDYPRISLSQFEFVGAFRLPKDSFGESTPNYSEGIFTYNPVNNSIFLVGHENDDAIAEFAIPQLGASNDIINLNAASILQNFSKVLNRTPDGNPDQLDRITGLYYSEDKLIVNAARYYDGSASAKDTTLLVNTASQLSSSQISGFFEMEGGLHSGGWISEIPSNWATLLNSTHLSGFASNLAINSRNPIGPTAFLVDPQVITSSSSVIATTALLDFDLNDYLYDTTKDSGTDWIVWGQNVSGNPSNPDRDSFGNVITLGNDLWTEKSNAFYGFIIPGTSTYAVFGSSGGHDSGVGYKITQDDGTVCGGYCSYVATDNYNYYWLWDVNDFIEVYNGNKQPSDLRPYEYGEFPAPYQYDGSTGLYRLNKIGGGSFDKSTSSLFLSLRYAGQTGLFDRPPLILKYRIDL